MSASMPASKGPVEKKVTWSALGAYVAGVVVLAVLQLVGADPTLISGMPDWLEAVLVPMIPAVVSFVGGYVARHTPRPDLEDSQEPKGPGTYRMGPPDPRFP